MAKDVAPQTGQTGRLVIDAASSEEISLGRRWPPAVQPLASGEHVSKMLQGLLFNSSVECATCVRALHDIPAWASETARNCAGLFQSTGWRLTVDRSSVQQCCAMCLPIVLQTTKTTCPVPRLPDFGLDSTVISALTYFEELLLCPVHCVVQVCVTWATENLKYIIPRAG